MFLRTFRGSFILSAIALVAAFFYGSWPALLLCVVLGVMEVSLSFDNAVMNAKILRHMSEFWQKIFLTVGIAIAVVGMRLVFPLLVVGITAGLNPYQAITLAMEKGDPHVPGTYGFLLGEAHPQIAAFGGMFLLMIFLDWIFEERDIKWLRPIEAPLARVGELPKLSVLVGLVLLVLSAEFLAKDVAIVLLSGILGTVTYMAVKGLDSFLESHNTELSEDDDAPVASTGSLVVKTGKAAFVSFLYLEVLDASFSFDGVIGAFAITSDPIIIALGLGLIGAIFVRSITVYLVRGKKLDELVYLEHGAHWAIGALAVILLISVGYHINEFVTGLIGVVIIVAAYISSRRYAKREEAEEQSASLIEAQAVEA